MNCPMDLLKYILRDHYYIWSIEDHNVASQNTKNMKQNTKNMK